mgnify:CR=1 FL=1
MAIGITLPLQLGKSGYFEQSYDVVTQLKSNFINLILTRKGERLHQPNFGCDIHKYLFENITPENLEGARLSVINAVEEWMPFLELLQFELKEQSQNADNNTIYMYITYRLRNNPNVQDSIVLTF